MRPLQDAWAPKLRHLCPEALDVAQDLYGNGSKGCAPSTNNCQRRGNRKSPAGASSDFLAYPQQALGAQSSCALTLQDGRCPPYPEGMREKFKAKSAEIFDRIADSMRERFKAKSSDRIDHVVLNEVQCCDFDKHTLDRLAVDAGIVPPDGAGRFSARLVSGLRYQCGVRFVQDLCLLSDSAIWEICGVSEVEKECVMQLREHLCQKHSCGALLSACLPVHNTFIHFQCVSSIYDCAETSLFRATSPGRIETGAFRIKTPRTLSWQSDGSLVARQSRHTNGADTRTFALPAVISTVESSVNVRAFIVRNKLDSRTAKRLIARPASVQEAVVASGDLHEFDSHNRYRIICGRIHDIESMRNGAIGGLASSVHNPSAMRRDTRRSTC